jgi:hypothetical protein
VFGKGAIENTDRDDQTAIVMLDREGSPPTEIDQSLFRMAPNTGDGGNYEAFALQGALEVNANGATVRLIARTYWGNTHFCSIIAIPVDAYVVSQTPSYYL